MKKKKLLNHKIKYLDIAGCDKLTEKSLEEINKNCSDELLELKLRGNWKEEESYVTKILVNNSILPMSSSSYSNLFTSDEPSAQKSYQELAQAQAKVQKLSNEQSCFLRTHRLQKLSICDIEVTDGISYYAKLFMGLSNLTHLDMSNFIHRDGMDEFAWLPKYLGNTLQSLIKE